MKRKPTGGVTGLWCSNCRQDVMEVEEREGGAVEIVEHCACTLGQFKTDLQREALLLNHWKGMIP